MPIYNARREKGVCRGSLWKQHCAGPSSASGSTNNKFNNDRAKYHDYCVLVGNTLTSYPDYAAFKRGEFPMSEIRIVGASSWTPAVSRVANSFSPKVSSVTSSATLVSTVSSSTATSTSSSGDGTVVPSSSNSPTFRIVTFAGTHVYCTAPNVHDRNVWLAALHSGLEASYTGLDNLELLSQIRRQQSRSNSPGGLKGGCSDCAKCGVPLNHENPTNDISSKDEDLYSTESEGLEDDQISLEHEDDFPDDGTENSDPWDARHAKQPDESALKRQQSAERRSKRLSQALDPSPIKKKQSADASKLHSHNGRGSLHVLPANNTLFMESDLFTPPRPQHLYETSTKYCKSCGAAPPPPNADHTVSLHPNAVPLSHYNAELRVDYICNNCLIAQGVLSCIREWNGLYSGMMHERAALNSARALCVATVDKVMRDTRSIVGNGAVASTSSSGNAMTGSGGSEESQSTGDSWENLQKASTNQVQGHSPAISNPTKGSAPKNPGSSWHCIHSSPEQIITSALLQLLSSSGFATLRRRSKTLDLECQRLERVVTLGGVQAVVEFLENIDSMCGVVPAESLLDEEDHSPSSDKPRMDPIRRRLELKKEALKISGDMTTAMKLLHDNALGISSPLAPPRNANLPSTSNTLVPLNVFPANISGSGMHSSNSLDMLTCLLELLLDLCHEGELAAVAFFWPQLRHIHLSMLPPANATEMCHVELMEDFLLTVACKYSVQLALELVWGCLADLEEGLGHTLASHWNMVPMEEEEGEALPAEVGDKIRRRRWCVMRFLCELESLMFGFEGGWGGGKVCLRGTLTPSEHQSLLIRESVAMLQVFRLESPYYLSRSVRRDLLRAEKAIMQSRQSPEKGPDHYCPRCARTVHASGSFNGLLGFEPTVMLNTEMLMRNAHFLSSQLNFIRKLSEVAEKLRFLPVNRRNHALKSELKKINLYLTEANRKGRIGAGDPIAIPTFEAENDNEDASSSGQLTKVVHLPINEGHVFRSKARTPVLLVFEVMHPLKAAGSGITSESVPPPSALVLGGEAMRKSTADKEATQVGSPSPDADADGTDLIVGHVEKDSPPQAQQEGTDETTDERVASEIIVRNTLDSTRDGNVRDYLSPTPPSPSSKRASILQRLESPLMQSGHISMSQRLVMGDSINEDEETKESPWMPNFSDSAVSMDGNNLIGPDDVAGANRSRNNSTGNRSRNNSQMEDMTELVQTAMQDKLVLGESVKMPKLEEMGGASDPATAAARKAVTTSISYDRGEEADASEEYRSALDDSSNKVSAADSSSMSKLSSTSEIHGEASCALASTPKKNQSNRRVVDLTKNVSRKMTALGGASQRAVQKIHSTNTKALCPPTAANAAPAGVSQSSPYGIFSQERREVLTTILATGMKGNPIAKGAAAAAKKSIQNIDRRNALEMMSAESGDPGRSSHKSSKSSVDPQNAPKVSLSRGAGPGDDTTRTATQLAESSSPFGGKVKTSISNKEEDECMESLRLILLQNRVAQGNLTPEGAARALVGPEEKKHGLFNFKGKDAGEMDPRLAGCGTLSHAIHSALKLWKEGTITNAELLELAHRDQQFVRQSLPGSENMTTLMEDSAFWVRFAFGERWAEKKSRISARSPYGRHDGWDLVSVIVKSNDDLRQEAFIMQLIQLCKEAFELAGLELWLLPYRIVSTGKSTGIIETLKNTLSFDAIKKKPGYSGLRGHFERMTEFATNPKKAFEQAQANFVRSLAAYSLLSYLFQFKDRHNGNLMLDTEGHMVHIDFGFVFGIAPGGAFSLEATTPFKLTDEMIEVMGGLNSALFSEFVTLFSCGFLALQQHCETFCTLVEITCRDSAYPCFAGKDPSEVIDKLRARFCPSLDKGASVAFALDLIKQALTSYGTRQYDFYQYMSQGIAT